MTSTNSPVLDRVNSLRKKLAGMATVPADDIDSISTDCQALDQLLPGGALRKGMLIELLSEDRGSGAGSLAMHCCRQAVEQWQGCLVVVDRWRRFYPPAAVARGIETKDLIMVRSSDHQIMSAAEELWALDQALRCPGVSVVLAWLDKVDPLAFRRLQLAAESGQTLALLLRPARVKSLPTWSDVQLLVQPRGAAGVPVPARSSQTSSATRPSHKRDGEVKIARQQSETHGFPFSPDNNENRRLRVTMIRQRGRAGSNTREGTSVELEMNDGQAAPTLNEIERRNESRPMHMAPRVAHPAARRRSTGA